MTLKIGWLHEAENCLGAWLHEADDWQIGGSAAAVRRPRLGVFVNREPCKSGVARSTGGIGFAPA